MPSIEHAGTVNGLILSTTSWSDQTFIYCQFHGTSLLVQGTAHRLRSIEDGRIPDNHYKPDCLFESPQIYEQFGDAATQTRCLRDLAWLLCKDEQLDSAEEAACHVIELLAEKDDECLYMRISSYSRQRISVQGRQGEGHSPFRSDPRDRVLFQRAAPG